MENGERCIAARTAVTPAVIAEGDNGTSSLLLNIVRTGNRDKPATATWQVAPSGSNPVDLDDFLGGVYPGGTVIFGIGDGIETVTLPIAGDQVIEPDETFQVFVTGTNGGPITGGPRTATIVNDDVTPPPSVVSVEINEGAVQRSTVTKVQVTFDRLIDAPSSAFTLTNLGTTNAPANLPVTGLLITPTDDGSQTVVMLSLPEGRSLSDGNYRLDIDGSQVSGRGGGPSMALDYVFGDLPEDGFYRKFGDINANGTVELLDFAEFRRTFGKSSLEPGYQAGFDSNNDNMIALLDFANFRRNFGT